MNNYLRFSISGSNKFCQFSSFSFLKWSASRFSRETRIEVYQMSPYFFLFINYVDSPLEVFSRETRIEVYQMSPYFLLFINYVDSPLEVFSRETRIEVYQMSQYFLLFINYVDSPLEVGFQGKPELKFIRCLRIFYFL